MRNKYKSYINEKAYVQKSVTYAFLTKIKNCYVECCLAYVFRVLLPRPLEDSMQITVLALSIRHKKTTGPFYLAEHFDQSFFKMDSFYLP